MLYVCQIIKDSLSILQMTKPLKHLQNLEQGRQAVCSKFEIEKVLKPGGLEARREYVLHVDAAILCIPARSLLVPLL